MRGSTQAVIIVLLLLLSGGCSTTVMPRYYLLNPLSGEPGTHSPCVSLGIGPVKVPEYLNRPQIVTRASTNELFLGQYDRWAEPLGETFPRVLAENLSKLLCARSTAIYPWKSSAQIDYRVEAEVIRMDGVLGKEAILEVWWTISGGPEKKVLVSRQARFREPAASNDYESFVQAQSRLSAQFSKELAEAIVKLGK